MPPLPTYEDNSRTAVLPDAPTDEGIPEQLVEMFRRKARRAVAAWGAKYLEDPKTFCWQPETLMYRDIHTGHEVWKLTDTPLLVNCYHDDIGVSPWSATESEWLLRLRSSTQAFRASSGSMPWMTVDTSGTRFRPTVEAMDKWSRTNCNDYFSWSPQVPDVYYQVGYAWWPLVGRDLYKYGHRYTDIAEVDIEIPESR